MNRFLVDLPVCKLLRLGHVGYMSTRNKKFKEQILKLRRISSTQVEKAFH